MQNDNFSRHYYELLVDFSTQLERINNKLTVDKSLIDHYKIGLPELSASGIINYCILYDLTRIVTRICGSIDKDTLEGIGLVLGSNKIVKGADSDLLASGYDVVLQGYKKGIYKNVVGSYVRIANDQNPFRLKASDIGDNSRPANEIVYTEFSLPAALRHMKHPLFDEYVTVLYRFANIIAKASGNISPAEEAAIKKIYHDLHYPIPEVKPTKATVPEEKGQSIESIMDELEELIGLTRVKEEIRTMVNFIKVQKSREASGLKSSDVSYHIVFTGNPGTGKTTVARIVAKVYNALGILSGGQLIETDRSGLVAEYVGQTAVKVNKVVDSSINGILFIDEAYSLSNDSAQDFGKEAVATLVKRMEDDRDKLVVIVAGYTDEMQKFIDTNPGLRSRFNRYIEFPDYTPDELYSIFVSLCVKSDYIPTKEAGHVLKEILTEAFNKRDRSFGNARFVRNIFEKTLERHANRIASIPNLTREVLITITEEDVLN